MENKFFLHQVKHTNGVYEKGIVVKDDLESAKQGYHAYLGAYGYAHDPNTDYVFCMITDIGGGTVLFEVDDRRVQPEPEPEPEEEQ